MIKYLLVLVLILGGAVPGLAEPVHTANVRAELISDVGTVAPGMSFWVGLRMVMDEQWHTYWRNPGDSGMATRVDWDLPEGFSAGELHWPYPERIDYAGGLTGYGYEGEVVLLTEMTAPAGLETETAQTINAKVNWLSCHEICVPGKAALSLTLDIGGETDGVDENARDLFEHTRQRWPVEDSPWQVDVRAEGDAFIFNVVSSERSHPVSAMAFFPYRNDIIDHAGQQVLRPTDKGYRLTVPKSVVAGENIERMTGVFVSPVGWNSGGQKQGLLVDVSIN